MTENKRIEELEKEIERLRKENEELKKIKEEYEEHKHHCVLFDKPSFVKEEIRKRHKPLDKS